MSRSFLLSCFLGLRKLAWPEAAVFTDKLLAVCALLAGRKFTSSAGDLPAVKLPAGLDSLYAPLVRRAPLDQDAFDNSLDEGDRADGLRDMESALRDALSVQRANAFVAGLSVGKGDRLSSAEFSIDGDKGFSDLISLLLHPRKRIASAWRLTQSLPNRD